MTAMRAFLVLAPLLLRAEDVVVTVKPTSIQVSTTDEIKSFDEKASYAYLVVPVSDGNVRIVQLHTSITKHRNGVTFSTLQCDAPGGREALDLREGNSRCGVAPLLEPSAGPPSSRDVNVVLSSVLLANATKPSDIAATGTYSLSLEVNRIVAGREAVYLSFSPRQRQQQMLEALAAIDPSEIKVSLKFSTADNVPDYDIRVTHAGPSGNGEPATGQAAGDFIKLSLSEFLPSRPEAYKLTVSIDKTKLPEPIQRLIDREMDALVGATKISPEPAAPPRESASFFLDLTFTSTVTAFDPSKPIAGSSNGQRRNAGLFALAYKPVLKEWEWGLSGGSPDQGTPTIKWLGIRPYISADISTLPLDEAEVPTQIAEGVDFEYGLDFKRHADLRGLVFTAGPRHESDRDLKFQLLFGKFTIAPVFHQLVQSRAYRASVARNRKTNPFLTAYAIRPSTGYEIGDVVRDRPDRLSANIYFQDYISRYLLNLDVMLEFKRFVTLSASDTYYYHWKVARRPQRNYVEAKAVLNTGYLFRRHIWKGLQHGIEGKFQRGEQSPKFTPVNVFSIGITFSR